jgi:phosphatidylglycerophosphatase A
LGLGYGAGQAFITSTVFLTLVVIIVIWASLQTKNLNEEYNLMIEWHDKDITLDEIIAAISKNTKTTNLRRYNAGSQGNTLFLKANITKPSEITELQRSVQLVTKSSTLSISEVNIIQ